MRSSRRRSTSVRSARRWAFRPIRRFPLYKSGTVVGGVGVMADDIYGPDPISWTATTISMRRSLYAATFGFSAPVDRRADRITADGKTLRFSDLEFADLRSPPRARARCLYGLSLRHRVHLDRQGQRLLRRQRQARNRLRASSVGDPARRRPAFSPAPSTRSFWSTAPTTRATGRARAPIPLALGGAVLSAVGGADGFAGRAGRGQPGARAQYRRPVGLQVRVTISVVDSNGEILGIVKHARRAGLRHRCVAAESTIGRALLLADNARRFLAQPCPTPSMCSTSDPAGRAHGARGGAGRLRAPPTRTFVNDGPGIFADGRIAWTPLGPSAIWRARFSPTASTTESPRAA